MDEKPGGISLIDPGLFFEGGHHASLARIVAQEMERRGVGCAVYGLARIDHPPVGIDIIRHFSASAYARIDADSPSDSLAAWNRSLETEFRALPIRGEGETFLLPTVTSRIVLAASRWIASLPRDGDWSVSMMLMFPPGFAGDERLRDAERSVYRESFSLLREMTDSRVRLFAETERIAGVFESLGSPAIRTLSWPITIPCSPGRRQEGTTAGGGVRITHLGYTKLERGFGLLPGIVERVRSSHRDAGFTVQANYWDPTGLAEPDARLASMPGVRMLRGPQPPDVYADELAGADIVLLPYSAEAYRHRGSGVFVEAASLGRVLVVPSGTWMSEHAEAWGLGAVAFDRFDEECVAVAVRRAIDDRHALLERAGRAKNGWNAARDPAVFVDAVLGVETHATTASHAGEAA
jgi:hypothetical protein